LAESYPNLKANQSFLELQKELSDTEDRIQHARRFYNGNVRDLSNRIEVFPSNIIAGMFGFQKREYFELEDGAIGVTMFLVFVSTWANAADKVVTQETLLDRIQVEDMIVRYYVDMSAGKSHNLTTYYTEDAVLDVNGLISKGREAIEKLYESTAGPFTKRSCTSGLSDRCC
jgi:LemA family